MRACVFPPPSFLDLLPPPHLTNESFSRNNHGEGRGRGGLSSKVFSSCQALFLSACDGGRRELERMMLGKHTSRNFGENAGRNDGQEGLERRSLTDSPKMTKDEENHKVKAEAP